jgi:preprotein translocase subunit YajC
VDPIGLLLLVAAGAAFYFLIIRPGKQRQRAQQELVSSLQPGSEVMTVSGIYGTVAAVTDDEVSIEISPGVFVRMVPGAIGKVIEPKPVEDDPVD